MLQTCIQIIIGHNLRVELAVSLVRNQSGVTKVVTGSLGLLGESNNIGRRSQVPVLVAPEFAGGAESCA